MEPGLEPAISRERKENRQRLAHKGIIYGAMTAAAGIVAGFAWYIFSMVMGFKALQKAGTANAGEFAAMIHRAVVGACLCGVVVLAGVIVIVVSITVRLRNIPRPAIPVPPPFVPPGE